MTRDRLPPTSIAGIGRRLCRYTEFGGRWLQQWRRFAFPVPRVQRRPFTLPKRHGFAGGVEVSVVGICRDEGPYIREWIEFHRNVGIERFVIYDNGSTDGTLDVLADLARAGDITVIPWPAFMTSHDTQTLAYHHAISLIGAKSRWIAFIDVDEFLFPLDDRPIGTVLRDYAEMPAVSLPWVNYSSSGHAARPPGRVTENYLYRAPFPPPAVKNTLLNYKSIVRPEFTDSLTKHFPNITGDHAHFFTERKERVHKANYINPAYATSEIFRLNHYFGKSEEEFRAKVARGPISQRRRRWRKMDRYLMIEDETVFDDVAARKWPTFALGPRTTVA